MKKLLYLVFAGLVMTSCSTEELTTADKGAFNLTVLDNSATHLGTYKGTFAAFGSAKRGTVVITITESFATAELKFADGTSTTMTGTSSDSSLSGLKQYAFNAIDGTFNFNVALDGSSPEASAVSLTDGPGSIVLAKDTDATPVRLATGTFGCEDCGDHPVLSDENAQNSFIWNAIFSGEGTEAGLVMTQVSFGETWFVDNGVIFEAYDKVGLLLYNDLEGSFPFGDAGLVSWTGTQMFSVDGACIDLRGNWTLTSPSYEVTGWLKSDDSCNPL